jgi:hypothetical protein
MMIADSRKPKWFFYPGWVVLNTLGIPIAWLISYFLSMYVSSLLADYVFSPLLGLLTGLLQYLLLRRYLPRIGWWIAATTLVWPLVLTLFHLGYAMWPIVLANSTWPTAEDALRGIGFVSVGVVTGLVQWLVLRRRVPRAGWWILANALGWGLVNLIVGEFDSLVIQLSFGAMPAIVTSLALWWLLAYLPQHGIAVNR